ncbi:hypothetical protein RSB1_gp19 [Ralstonia phage RSB1]|uniref:Uncharacterized protein n=1 Tax=Ralstonia phage RSB1 TaxID=551790 RepID=B5BTV5_9CAUD|nr:hypothetical protein RSB1_gp19 [Ralstonia phage RSB1]BAG70377.1 hypothetical protein [Ralstonia phage RSB1]
MALNLKKLAQKAAKTQDLTKEQAGGDYAPPAKGVPGVRFVGYIETGKVEGTFKGQTKVQDKAHLLFELHGKRWPASEGGRPQMLTVKLNKSKSSKSGYIKLFKAMNYEGNATTFVELLGGDYIANVFHYENEGKTFATFKDDATGIITVRAPFVENEDGEPQRRKVPEAMTDIKAFLWDDPDMDQWKSIFIDGEYDDGKSKNRFQNAIKDALNFEGSPAEALLEGDPDTGDDDDIEDAKAAAKAAKAAKAKAAAAADTDDDDATGTDEEVADDDEQEEVEPTPPAKPKTAAKAAPKAAAKPAAKAKPATKKPPVDEDDPMGDIPDGSDDE